MKIAYLILAHNSPKHLQRLIRALASPLSSFFIHLDKKSNIDEFSGIQGNTIHFVQERIPVFWGDFSVVEATLILLRNALADQGEFCRFVLLSGADYPLRPAVHIEKFFENNPSKEYMNLVAMPCEEAGKPLSRLTTFKLRPGERTINKVLRKVLMRVGILPRKRDYKATLQDLVPYGGSTWWALSREACDFIMTSVKKEVPLVSFFTNTIIPDESFFQTILGNSPFRSRIVRNLTYADWSAGGPSPAYITEKHLAFFQSASSFPPDGVYGGGEMLFARKFADASEALVARLESQGGQEEYRF